VLQRLLPDNSHSLVPRVLWVVWDILESWERLVVDGCDTWLGWMMRSSVRYRQSERGDIYAESLALGGLFTEALSSCYFHNLIEVRHASRVDLPIGYSVCLTSEGKLLDRAFIVPNN